MELENILNRTIEIEDTEVNTIMAFSINEEGKIEKYLNCNIADLDNDYIFNTEKTLIRIQKED